MDTVTDTVTRDNLYAGDYPVVKDARTILSGAGALTKGSVLGLVSNAPGTPAITGTGDGAVSAYASVGLPKIGDHIATCIVAAANAGTFRVVDPDGVQIGDFEVAGAAFIGGGLTFLVADGANDFIVGDYITFPVAAGSGKAVLCDVAAVDGSQVFDSILNTDRDATSADKDAPVDVSGEFQTAGLTFGGSTTAADLKAAARAKNCYFVTTDSDENVVGD